ncbi:MAG: PrsW family glutamic-type intramembrane protease [Casimicrobiaceae bacterium]
MIYSVLIAAAVPLVFLYLVKRLNFFETHRRGPLYAALLWGALSVELSYLVSHPMALQLSRQFVGTHTGPIVEEIFKSLILLFLVRRSDHNFFVDGAIYGFASGVGFAVAENMLYLSRVGVDTGLIISITRSFSSSVMHGSSTALVGIAIGGFPLRRVSHPILAWIVGLLVAIAYHIGYNRVAYLQIGKSGLLVLVAAAFAGLLLVATAVMWAIARERRRLHRSLVRDGTVSKGEASLVQRLDDLDDLLAPVEQRFGAQKRAKVADALVLGAQLALQQSQIRSTKDGELRTELAAEITASKRELRRLRREIGVYAMSYVRTLVPRMTWSMWARLAQAIASGTPSVPGIWHSAAARQAPGGVDIYAQARAGIDARKSD